MDYVEQGQEAKCRPSAPPSAQAVCRVVHTSDIDWFSTGASVPHDEHDVEKRIRNEDGHRRDMRQRGLVAERLERERGEPEAEEMAARVAQKDAGGGRVVDEETRARTDERPSERGRERRVIEHRERDET